MTTQELTYGFPRAWNLFSGAPESQVFRFRFYGQSLFEIRDFVEHARREGEAGPFVASYGPVNAPDAHVTHLDKTPIFGCPPPLGRELLDNYNVIETGEIVSDDETRSPVEGHVLLLLRRRSYECGLCGARTENPTFEHGFAVCIAHGILHDFETEPREGSICRPHVPEKTAEWPVPAPPDTLTQAEESANKEIAELFEPAEEASFVLEPASEEARAFIEGEHADPSRLPVEAAPTEPAPAPEEDK